MRGERVTSTMQPVNPTLSGCIMNHENGFG